MQTIVQKGTPPQVTLGRVPQWFTRSALKAIREKRLPKPVSPRTAGWYVHRHVVESMDCAMLFDHWGCVGAKLVTEPYQRADDPELISQVKRFARMLGCAYAISSESNWLPGSTIRIEFWQVGN